MPDTRWRARLSVSLACKWLNRNTYAGIQVADPAASDPTQPYTLCDRGGRLRVSRLHNAALQPQTEAFTLLEQLLAEAEDNLSRGLVSTALARLPAIDTLAQRLNQPYTDPLQPAEVRFLLGWLYYRASRRDKALKLFQASVKDLAGIDEHGEALGRWAIGHILLEKSRPRLKEGLLYWGRAWELFARLAHDSFHHTRTDTDWYTSRAALMATDLHGATSHGGVVPPDPSLTTPIPIGHWGTPPAAAPPAAARLLLKNIPIFEALSAGEDGRVVAAPVSAEFAEFNLVHLNHQPYRLLDLHGQARVSLNPNDKHAFVRVTGDGLNAAQPQPILAGDYVLVRATPTPADGQIVVAVLADRTAPEQTAIKRKKADGYLYAESRTPYPPLSQKQVARFIGEVVALARPVS